MININHDLSIDYDHVEVLSYLMILMQFNRLRFFFNRSNMVVWWFYCSLTAWAFSSLVEHGSLMILIQSSRLSLFFNLLNMTDDSTDWVYSSTNWTWHKVQVVELILQLVKHGQWDYFLHMMYNVILLLQKLSERGIFKSILRSSIFASQ